MPVHLKERFDADKHTAGVILFRPHYAVGRYVEDLLLIWSTNSVEEWIDRTIYLPL